MTVHIDRSMRTQGSCLECLGYLVPARLTEKCASPGLEEFVTSQPGTSVLPSSQTPHVNGQIVLNVMSDDNEESGSVDETDMLHNDWKGSSKAAGINHR